MVNWRLCMWSSPSEYNAFLETYSVQDDIAHSLWNDIIVGCWNLLTQQLGKSVLNSGWWWNTCVIGIIIFLWTSLLFGPSNSMVPLCWLHWGFIWWVGSCTQQYTFISWLSLLSKTSLCSHMSHPWQKKAPGNHSCLLTPIAMCYCCKTCIIFFEEELLCPTSVSNPNTSSTSTIRNWFRDALIFSCCFPFVI